MSSIREQYAANIVLDHNYRMGSLIDQSRNGAGGTVNGTVQWTRGEKGRAIYFNAATNGYLSVLDSASLRPANITICVFGNFDTQTTTEELIYKRAVTTNYDFYVNATSVNLYDGTSISTLAATTTGCLMLATTLTSGSTPTFYKDGVKLGSGDNVLTLSTTNTPALIIGATNSGTSVNKNPFYEVIIFNTVLTQEEMALFYEEWLQEGNFDVPDIRKSINMSRNMVVDGDMESVDTSAWTSWRNGTLTKETVSPRFGTKNLKITWNGLSNSGATQAILTIGKRYVVTGYVRTDGLANAQVFVNSNMANTVATAATTDWVYFSVSGYADTTSFYLINNRNAAGYVEFDEVFVKEEVADNVYITQGRGWNTTLANVTSGSLENTSWRVISGTWSVVESFPTQIGAQILNDADMEAVGTTDWAAGSSAVLSKSVVDPHSGTQCLRVEYGGELTPYAEQGTATIGKTYRLTGWARTDGVSVSARVFVGNSTTPFTLNTTSTWKYFDITNTATSTTLVLLQAYTGGLAGQYCEFDDLQLFEVESEGHQLKTVASGAIFRPLDIPYGTWEFELFKGGVSTIPQIMLTASLPNVFGVTGQNGYLFQIDGNESIRFYKVANGVTTGLMYTANATISEMSWTSCKITRTIAGVWTFYIKVNEVWTQLVATVGTNPITDNTYTTSLFCSLDLDIGDMIRNFKFISYI